MEKPWEINPERFEDGLMTEEEALQIFSACDAAWVHDGDPKRPHAELASGMHSNGYFNCSLVLQYPNLCRIFARQLARRLDRAGIGVVDCVVGSAYAAITFSLEVAIALGVRQHVFTEKDPQNPKKMIFPRFTIPEGARVLQVEELITTSGTTQEVRNAVILGNDWSVCFYDLVAALVHRPPEFPENNPVIAVIEKEIWVSESTKCYLCAQGSKALKPKANWRELTGKK